MGIMLNVFFVSLCLTIFCTAHISEENNGLNINPYTEVLELYNLSTEVSFTLPYLEELVHEFVDRISCVEDAHHVQNCSENFCLNISRLIPPTTNISIISEETFINISVVLLDLAVKPNKSCHTVIDLEEDFDFYTKRLLSRLRHGDDSEMLQVLSLQHDLEDNFIFSHNEIHVTHDGHDDEEPQHGDEEPGHDDEEPQHGDEEPGHDDEEPGHDDEEPGHDNEEPGHDDEELHHGDEELLFQKKCLGADVVFDQLGIALDESILAGNIGHIAGLVVYHIINGANISRDCRLLPRRDFFFKELDHNYGNGNRTLGTEGLRKVIEALEIGGTHAQKESTEHTETTDHGHDHRRKRSTDMTFMLHKESWESTCYSDEQLLAIYHMDDVDMNEATFSTVCPALIQQKLSGACVKSEEVASEKSGTPSAVERYGYGSLATIITCFCSVIGAFVVKFSSDKAYEIIMALFLGLAVGTLYTDAMIHLLPTALGIHGHSEDGHDDHGHGSSGIVVEEFVWFSLAACGALYFFYLFEKTLILIRGQHAHSHGGGCISEEEKHETEINVSKAEIYAVDSISKEELAGKKTKSNKPTSTVAVMVLMGDAVHNMADGIAIGAAFSTSLALGLSTTIAVFCHELPHELGDFAILLASGLSFGRAIFLNVIVSLMAIIGLYVGLAVSDDETVRQWIVAVTAGLFIYISLVDMMPQMLQRSKHGVRDFFLNNVGILLGAGAMLLLAIFEEKIKISL